MPMSHEVVYVLPFSCESPDATLLVDWLATQSDARWIRLVHRQHTLGWIDRDRAALPLTWTTTAPGSLADEPWEGALWPWSQTALRGALQSTQYTEAEADLRVALLQWAQRLPPHRCGDRAARGLWHVLALQPRLAPHMAEAMERWAEAVTTSAYWTPRLRALLSEAPVAPPLHRALHKEQVLARLGIQRALFPLDPPDRWVAVDWVGVARESASLFQSHRALLVRGELWVPWRVALPWLWRAVARQVLLHPEDALPCSSVARRSSPAGQHLTKGLLDAWRRLLPSPRVVASTDVRSWPPCLRRAWLQPRHMKYEERSALWSSWLAAGLAADALVAWADAHAAVFYPDGSNHVEEYRREIRGWARTVARRGPGCAPEMHCATRRSRRLVSATECAACDKECDVEDLALRLTPSQRVRHGAAKQ